MHKEKTKFKKVGKMNELAWLIGNVLCAFGVVLTTKASFGLSMIAAPPYILHVFLSKFFSFFTQGTAEYVFQTAILIFICIFVRKVRFKYFMCFLTSVFFGLMIDFWLLVLGGGVAYDSLALRIVAFVVGELLIALAIAFTFRTYLPVQMPECLVMEISKYLNKSVEQVKRVVDIAFFCLSIVLSLVLTSGFTGVGIGTVIISFANAYLIKWWGNIIDKIFVFTPLFVGLEKKLK